MILTETGDIHQDWGIAAEIVWANYSTSPASPSGRCSHTTSQSLRPLNLCHG
ncbi:hypothetical protein HMPREF9599_00463 [Cutibacterium acnes HL050PA2]|nr:hypothetical protein HMPREF9599_00463 [Cutibacterium acnes HL050PA2]